MKNIFVYLSLVLLFSCSSEDAIIYQWRGEGRKGVFPENNLLTEWPANGPGELWSINGIGSGHGSPTFTDDRFYITGEKDSMAVLQCYNFDGAKQWESVLGPEWMKSYPGSRSAPTIAGKLLYTVTGTGDIFCVNTHSGKIIWYKDFDNDSIGVPTMHGFTEAPVVDGNKVFWVPGGKKMNVLALNRFTGETLWSSEGLGERSGYNQGNLIVLPERSIFVTFSAYHLMGFDTENGDLLWYHEQDNLTPEERILGMGDTHSNCIIYENGSLYYQAGDGNGGVRLDVSPDGTNITEIWRNRWFDGFMGGIIKKGEYIYGSSASKPELRVVNAASGEEVDSLRIGQGAIMSANNLLYYYSQAGIMYLISPGNGHPEVISSFRITRGQLQHFSHPVINSGILFQRHGDVLMAFNIKDTDD